jgi:DNA-binding beta-propeller fold protein YncE
METVCVWDTKTRKNLFTIHRDLWSEFWSSFPITDINDPHDVNFIKEARTAEDILRETVEQDISEFRSAVLSPDGKNIVTASTLNYFDPKLRGDTRFINGSLRVWDAESGKELLKLKGQGGLEVVISPDGKKIITAGCDGIVRILDVESGKELKKLEGHTAMVRSVAISPDGKKIASASEDKTVRIWTLE